MYYLVDALVDRIMKWRILWVGPTMMKFENLLKFSSFIHDILASNFEAIFKG